MPLYQTHPKDAFWYMRKDKAAMKLTAALQNCYAKAPNKELVFSSMTRNGHDL